MFGNILNSWLGIEDVFEYIYCVKIEQYTKRAPGGLVRIPGEPDTVRAFVPDPLPRNLNLTSKISRLNEEAGVLLGKIQSAGDVLDPTVELYLKQEAIASNRIEGTITTAKEIYLFEVEEAKDVLSGSDKSRQDRQEVSNYVRAMKQGVQELKTRPLNINLILQLHAMLLQGVRGEKKAPGIIRTDQNAIAVPSKPTIADARFIPPPASYVKEALYDLESYVHEDSDMPDLTRTALFHYQFETIHPFLDGNGRIGRLLVPLLLIQWEKLPPTLPRFYLSPHLAEHDEEYRDRLLRVSQNGEWNEWIEFFLSVVIAECNRSWNKALELRALKEDYLKRILDCPGKIRPAVDYLFSRPVIHLKNIARVSQVSDGTALNYANKLVERNILIANTAGYRNVYIASGIFRLFFDEHVTP